jgi:hypothetical protein
MAKYTPSEFVKQIRGSVGDKTFSNWKGIPVLTKKVNKRKQPNSAIQIKLKETFINLEANWKKLTLQEWASWEQHSKRYTEIKMKRRSGLIPVIGGKMTGHNAYISLNLLLIRCGYDPISTPPTKIESKPPTPNTDLINLGTYKNEIKFNLWLPYTYNTECVAQIWVRKIGSEAYPYITAIVPISNEPAQIMIDKIRAKKGKPIEFKKMENCRLQIQLRTVAKNGEFSITTPIYTVEVIR